MSQAVSAPIINSVVLPELPQKSRRGRKKSVGSLVFTDHGQAYIIGYDDKGNIVTITRPQAEDFAKKFYCTKRNWYVRFVVWLYNKHVLTR